MIDVSRDRIVARDVWPDDREQCQRGDEHRPDDELPRDHAMMISRASFSYVLDRGVGARMRTIAP